MKSIFKLFFLITFLSTLSLSAQINVEVIEEINSGAEVWRNGSTDCNDPSLYELNTTDVAVKYYNSCLGKFRMWNGTTWEDFGAGAGNNALMITAIDSPTITLTAADIESWNFFVIRNTQTNVTITIPPIEWTSLIFLNIYHEGTGTVTVVGDTGVTFASTDFTSKNIQLYSETDDVWKVREADGGSGSGDVTKVGTPADNQIGVWTGDGTIEGDTDLTFDTTSNRLDLNGVWYNNIPFSSSSFFTVQQHLMSGMISGRTLELILGTENANSNRLSLAYYHVGDNNSSNAFRVLFHTVGEKFEVNANGEVTFNNVYQFPNADGTANQVLQTDGAGNVDWATVSGGGGFENPATADLDMGGFTITNLGTDVVTSSGNWNLYAVNSNRGRINLINTTSGSSDQIRLMTNGVKRINITTNGDVGIGNITPTEVLDVNGNIKSSGQIVAEGTIDLSQFLIAKEYSWLPYGGGFSVVGTNNPTGIGTGSNVIGGSFAGGASSGWSYRQRSGAEAAFYESSPAVVAVTFGFYYKTQFGIATISGTDNVQFFGLSASNTALGNVDPSTLLNLFGVAADDTDTNMQFIHNDGTGSATKVDLGANFAKGSDLVLQLEIYNDLNSSTIYYRVKDLEGVGDTGWVAVSTDLPASTEGLYPHLYMNEGTGSGTNTIRLNYLTIKY